MSWYDDNDRVDGYHHASVRVSKRWRAGAGSTELAAGMDRITGAVTDYRPDLSRPTQGYVTLRLQY